MTKHTVTKYHRCPRKQTFMQDEVGNPGAI